MTAQGWVAIYERLAPGAARCPHCGDPTRGLLAGCDKPDCLAKDIEREAQFKRLEDI